MTHPIHHRKGDAKIKEGAEWRGRIEGGTTIVDSSKFGVVLAD